MAEIVALDAGDARRVLPELIRLLQDAVAGGASIGFLPPLSDDQASAYWHGIIDDLAGGRRVLLVAVQDGRVVGSVQMEPAGRANAAHRAEVQRLLVHRNAR